MNYMSRTSRIGSLRIRDDRDLLVELGLSDAAAATYLGKSRQALNVQLGAKRSSAVRQPYFKLSEILVLVIAAEDRGHQFDEEAVWQFVEETARLRTGGSEQTFKLLKQHLDNAQEVDLTDVGTVLMVLPAFADMRAQLPNFSRDLRRLVEALDQVRPRPWVGVLSSSSMQAQMAAEWLTLPEDRSAWFTNEQVDSYGPTVLVFPRQGGEPRPYTVTDRGGLGPATQFRAQTMGEYVKFMLPPKARVELFTYEEEEEEEGSEEVRHRRRAQGR